MREDTVVQLRQPGSFEDDPLTEVLRLGARRLLGQAVEAEVAGFVEAYAHLTDSAGRRRIVRHGRYVTFQMAEVAIPRDLFADILRRIDRLRPNPSPA